MARRGESIVIPEVLLRLGKWRYPFLLVDKLVEFKAGVNGHVDAVKNVTFNEPYFVGHFPHSPIMPGVLIGEVLNQTSDYHTLLSEFCLAYQARYGEVVDTTKRLSQFLHTARGLALIDTIKVNTIGYLASQDLRFKRRVQPGDVISTHCELTLVDDKGFVHYRVEAQVDRQVVCTGRIVNFRTNNLGAGRGLAGGYRMDADYPIDGEGSPPPVDHNLSGQLDAITKGL